MPLCEFQNPYITSTGIPENVSTLIYGKWDALLTDLEASDVEWLTKRDDAAKWQGPGLGTKNAMVACYSASPSIRTTVLSNDWWIMDQGVTVDVALKVTDATADAMRTLLTKIASEVERIIHSNQQGILGVRFARIMTENTHIEGKNLLRFTFTVNCQWFHMANESCWFFTFME
jgi:hypothetical protein